MKLAVELMFESGCEKKSRSAIGSESKLSNANWLRSCECSIGENRSEGLNKSEGPGFTEDGAILG